MYATVLLLPRPADLTASEVTRLSDYDDTEPPSAGLLRARSLHFFERGRSLVVSYLHHGIVCVVESFSSHVRAFTLLVDVGTLTHRDRTGGYCRLIPWVSCKLILFYTFELTDLCQQWTFCYLSGSTKRSYLKLANWNGRL